MCIAGQHKLAPHYIKKRRGEGAEWLMSPELMMPTIRLLLFITGNLRISGKCLPLARGHLHLLDSRMRGEQALAGRNLMRTAWELRPFYTLSRANSAEPN